MQYHLTTPPFSVTTENFAALTALAQKCFSHDEQVFCQLLSIPLADKAWIQIDYSGVIPAHGIAAQETQVAHFASTAGAFLNAPIELKMDARHSAPTYFYAGPDPNWLDAYKAHCLARRALFRADQDPRPALQATEIHRHLIAQVVQTGDNLHRYAHLRTPGDITFLPAFNEAALNGPAVEPASEPAPAP